MNNVTINQAGPVMCKSDGCRNEAKWDVFWPGQTTQMCDGCFSKALVIANVMGFVLDKRPVQQSKLQCRVCPYTD